MEDQDQGYGEDQDQEQEITLTCLIVRNRQMRLKIEAELLMRVVRSIDSDKLSKVLADYRLFATAAARMR